ncbi:FtsW/RodA/SpoVE family cell cycle protein [Candidatus Collierbacteria bacterium]|nr:FtsW/RodA/SpoVE family cell cycle protein [Candidatus Collierbacteria bacterium]
MKSLVLILLASSMLLGLGLMMLLSIAPEKVLPQALFAVFSLLAGWVVFKLGIKNLLPFVWIAYIGILVLLILTLIYGKAAKGSSRWIKVGSFQFQASELAKPILLLASIKLIGSGWPISSKKQIGLLVKYGLVLFFPFSLIIAQPDLGSALVLMAIAAWIFMATSPPKGLLIGLGVAGLICLPLSKFGLKDYQLLRLQSFINPYSDPLGSGYHVIQSTIAVGSGEIFGRGLGFGTQGKLRFLPERQTDFIFANLVEELGLAGGVTVIGLYSIIVGICFWEAVKSRKPTERLIFSGIGVWLFFQTSVNIAMNLGIVPVTGVTLPLLSYGGSSLLSSAITLALAFSAMNNRELGSWG